MKNFRWFAILVLVAGQVSMMHAQEKPVLAERVFFKNLVGEWKTEGDLAGADGNTVKITEEWKGRAGEDGTFVMEGKRKIGDGAQDFKWTISYVNGLYEVSHHTNADGAQETTRFEASLSEVALTMELNGYIGDGSSKITIVDSFPDKDDKTMESQVTLADASGNTTLSGKLVHKRVPAP